ncbi:S-adenosyl-L-methionine-dependent methyltransferase [Cantharellus anzutake]|uniref:S-adenosyl-L-methionine-dependent methyltransferase n=1 Tax=Cantharellus anzutake TaxID=1750568 RepID=UPI0019071F0C|nr:S-adenosyl-L-methionine-dependent methyltransferase [Cantharellus anzutake]KAF8339182.1 S-adenosyl-L-methionine-dependent methyltransferase [Cantharellus anzutake]
MFMPTRRPPLCIPNMSVNHPPPRHGCIYRSSREGPFLRESDGRVFNAQNDVYYLPADDVEFDRLALQHRIHYHILGSLYPGGDLVDRILAPEWGVEKAVLDVGCGACHWAVEMALKFPHVHVIGVDLAPRTNIPEQPPNLRLEFDDANLGFPHYHGCFDVIHCRSIVTVGIHDRDQFFQEMERCLRPGGIIIVIDGEMPTLNHNRQRIPPAPMDGNYPQTRGWMARIMFEASQDFAARGASPIFYDIAGVLFQSLVATGAFFNPVIQLMYLPLGPWPVGNTEAETRWIQQLGEMMRQNGLEFTRSLRPTLKHRGFSDEDVDKMLFGAEREMLDLSVWMYTRWVYIYAVKPR